MSLLGNLIFLPTTHSRWIFTTNSNNQANISSIDNIDFQCTSSNQLFVWDYKNNNTNKMISIDPYKLWITIDTSCIIITTDYNDILDIICLIDYVNNSDTANYETRSSISIILNKSPKGGYCYYENYEIICDGWNDIEQDYPLFYSFVLHDNIHLSDIQISNRLSNVFLPKSITSITAYIYDSHFAVTQYQFDVNMNSSYDNDNYDTNYLIEKQNLNANRWIMAFLADIDASVDGDSDDDIYLDYWFNATLRTSDSFKWNLFMKDGSPLRYLEVISSIITLSQS